MKYILTSLILTFGILLAVQAADAQYKSAPEDAKSYIIAPQDGAVVPPTFKVQFGLHGMGVAPSGIKAKNTGHHHILIDVDEMPDMSKPLPSTDHIIHFGGGQTETTITLEPGEHTLQLVLGNFAHIPHDPAVVSKKITVYVNEK